MRRLYRGLGLSLIPSFLPINAEAKDRIATSFSAFTLRQFNTQPYYLAIPLHLLGILVAISVCGFGANSMKFWKKLPFGALIDRLFYSFVLLVYYEDESVLRALGEYTGREKLIKYRAIWDESQG